jgi:hypothetical protein
VWLRRDRPDVFHPPPDATQVELDDEQDLIDKYYREFGVRTDCSPAAP